MLAKNTNVCAFIANDVIKQYSQQDGWDAKQECQLLVKVSGQLCTGLRYTPTDEEVLYDDVTFTTIYMEEIWPQLDEEKRMRHMRFISGVFAADPYAFGSKIYSYKSSMMEVINKVEV